MSEIRCPNPDCGHFESVHTADGCRVQVCACKGMNPKFVELMTGLNELAEGIPARPPVAAQDPFEATPGVRALMARAFDEALDAVEVRVVRPGGGRMYRPPNPYR